MDKYFSYLRTNPNPLLLVVLLFFCACVSDDEIKPESSGKSGDLLLVLDDQLYNSTAADSFVYMMNTEVEGLPQFESMFDLIVINEKDFTHLFRLHRNIITAHVDPEITDNQIQIGVKKNVWAGPQVVARIRARDTTLLKTQIMQYASGLFDAFNEAEREILIRNYKTIGKKEIKDDLAERFPFQLAIPKTFYPAKKVEQFYWTRHIETEYEQGLMIYSVPVSENDSISSTMLMSVRDSITKLHIPGPSDGSYMSTERRLAPDFQHCEINGNQGILTRGLWRTVGDFMGGPFINFTYIDETSNMLYSIDGYVYAPKYEKREKVRQLEAIIYSMQ